MDAGIFSSSTICILPGRFPRTIQIVSIPYLGETPLLVEREGSPLPETLQRDKEGTICSRDACHSYLVHGAGGSHDRKAKMIAFLKLWFPLLRRSETYDDAAKRPLTTSWLTRRHKLQYVPHTFLSVIYRRGYHRARSTRGGTTRTVCCAGAFRTPYADLRSRCCWKARCGVIWS